MQFHDKSTQSSGGGLGQPTAGYEWVLYAAATLFRTREDLKRLRVKICQISAHRAIFHGGQDRLSDRDEIYLADCLVLVFILAELHPEWQDDLAEIQGRLELKRRRYISEFRADFDQYVKTGILYCTTRILLPEWQAWKRILKRIAEQVPVDAKVVDPKGFQKRLLDAFLEVCGGLDECAIFKVVAHLAIGLMGHLEHNSHEITLKVCSSVLGDFGIDLGLDFRNVAEWRRGTRESRILSLAGQERFDDLWTWLEFYSRPLVREVSTIPGQRTYYELFAQFIGFLIGVLSSSVRLRH